MLEGYLAPEAPKSNPNPGIAILPHWHGPIAAMITRRDLIIGIIIASAAPAGAKASTRAGKLAAAAEDQIGRTVRYDPAYVRISYPGGDVPVDRGVCTDVVIRAYRDGLGIDLQRLVHEDMRANFGAYPKIWGLTRPDRNIDHRRVPNLQTFFRRCGAALAVSEAAAAYLPGDLVTMMLPGNLPHIALVSHHSNDDGTRRRLIHNIGAGTRLEDVLFTYPVTGHYRY